MYYQIKGTLTETSFEQCLSQLGEIPFVVILTPAEWVQHRDSFNMDFDINPNPQSIYNTKAEVNYASITGTFSIPDRKNLMGEDNIFSFALDEKGIVFIDKSGISKRLADTIARTRRWHEPCLELFLYDFLEGIISEDRVLLDSYEKELNKIEAEILEGQESPVTIRVNEIRGHLLEMRSHYEQLLDMGQIFEENENNFFKEENLRFFRLFTRRMERRQDMVSALRDYTVQVRDLYQTSLNVKQNHIMTILTIVTTIFMPLTLIVGWYGMNFRYMPELESPYAYPLVIFICLCIVFSSLWFFHKKKWL